MGQRRRMSTREAANALTSAMTSTDAMASDADDHVDPHNRANCTIDFVSSSMKPAPRKKKCAVTRSDVERPLKPDPANATTDNSAIVEIARTTASAAR